MSDATPRQEPTGSPAPEALEGAWFGSGPRIARLFHALVALMFLDAFVSLAMQVTVLFGERGLAPMVEKIESRYQQARLGWLDTPSWIVDFPGDASLEGGCVLGALLAVAALLGLWPRVCFAAMTFLYMGYNVLGSPFLSFQWDSMILEVGLLAALLPRDRPRRWLHLLLLVLLFKVYFESGLAKWQSSQHDWHDGSAMTFYYETSPLPTWLAWYAHHLPEAWHHFESRAALALELPLMLLAFGPRRVRLALFAVLTAFQVVNLATSNYGFFVYLTLCLHLFLLDDRDVVRAQSFVAARIPEQVRVGWTLDSLKSRLWPATTSASSAGMSGSPFRRRVLQGPGFSWGRKVATSRWSRRGAVTLFIAYYLVGSTVDGVARFSDSDRWRAWDDRLDPFYQPFRLVNTYHLFGHITRRRIEPTFQSRVGDEAWRSHAFHHKPGPIDRAPGIVAPHQPRVDFRLWFYGLRSGRSLPSYVRNLLRRMCEDPSVVQPLFNTKLPPEPDEVRVRFDAYTFTSPEEREATGNWWNVRHIRKTRAFKCPEPGDSGG